MLLKESAYNFNAGFPEENRKWRNLSMLRQIEHASLDFEEIGRFMKALKNSKLINRVLFASVGRVKREDIIPRLADFCLQIGGDGVVVRDRALRLQHRVQRPQRGLCAARR